MPEEPNIRDQKLVQYLVEAHGKEQQLETALQAHIAMTENNKPYRRRLQQHLSETKRHARDVERRVKQLGGKVDTGISVGNPIEAVETVQTLAKKGAAMAQGPIHMIRGTGEAEKLLKNAKTEYANEAEEVATYLGIEALANAVGDKETARLAKTICRDEIKMSKFLERQIETLTKQVAREEIPAAERNSASRSRRKPAARKSTSSARKSTSSASRSTSSARKSTSRSTSSRKKPATTRKRSTTSAASRSRSTSSSSSGSARKTTSSGRKRTSPSRNGAAASSSGSRTRSSSTGSGRKKTAARS